MALPQPIQIFRKDLTHLWPETLVVIALFAGFAWAAPSNWTGSPYQGYAQLLSYLLHVLLPVSWLVLISRLIHDEPLVGDRQFWTSRPYHWAKLLAAKVLFLVCFIYLPFLVMQCYLLKHSGFYPTTVIPALLHNLLLLTCIIIVPITAIAAVTGSFVRLLLTTLAALLAMLVLLGTVGYITFLRMQPPSMSNIITGLFIILPLAALVYQYATRRTAISRWLLIATPLVIALLVLITPATALIHSAYPVASGSNVPKLDSFPDQFRPKTSPEGTLRTFRNEVSVSLPFTVSGVDEKSTYVIDGVSATIDAPGVHWSSPYTVSLAPQPIRAGSPISFANFPIPLDIFNKIHATPADIHLSLATDHMKEQTASTWKATLLPFSIPGKGICTYSADNPDAPPTCRYPLKFPDPTFVSANVVGQSCSTPATPPVPGGAALTGASALNFDPIVSAPLQFRTSDQNPQHQYVLCPGTPMNFTEDKSEGRTRLEVEEKQIILDPYAARITPRVAPAPAQQPQGQPQPE